MVQRAQRSRRLPSRRGAPGRSLRSATAPTLAGASFVTAIALAAFLLFSLELLAARLVLPVFGGAPAVWTTALCFFTAMIFAAYALAHALAGLAPARSGAALLGLAGAAVALTLMAPSAVASLRVPGWPAAPNVLLALAVIAGPAALLFAMTTPLLSAWRARLGGDPWGLYAVSNAASLAALVAYPVLVEPFVGLAAQRTLLLAGLAGYAAIAAVVVGSVQRVPPRARRSAGTDAPAPGIRRQARWLLAAAVPAGLLSATTHLLQTDLVAAPFVWIGPLAAYLLSFVVAFSDGGRRRMLPVADRLVPLAATLLWVPFVAPGGWPAAAILIVEIGGFLVLAVAIHCRLARDRPPPRYLTRFYLAVAAGGLAATAFVALLAPLLFPAIEEYPALLIAGLVVLALTEGPGARWIPADGSAPRALLIGAAGRLLPYAATAGVLYAVLAAGAPAGSSSIGGLLFLGGIGVTVAATPRLTALATWIVLMAAVVANRPDPTAGQRRIRERTFFGVIEVRASGNVNAQYSGTTLHGKQFTDDKRGMPTTYYARSGPLGGVFDDLRGRTAGASIGAVGLGVGTIAAYTTPGDRLTFFEVDPTVTRIASNPAWFTFLRDAQAPVEVVHGDGRLSLAAVPPGSFDLLVLDAFSSDAVPVHLLTREALEVYRGTLRPGGVLAFNVSNRYYDLATALTATATSLHLVTAGRVFAPDAAMQANELAQRCTWLVVGGAADVSRLEARGWRRATAHRPVLTDDRSSLLGVLWFMKRDG